MPVPNLSKVNQQLQIKKAAEKENAIEKPIVYADPASMPDRISIICDNSGSMHDIAKDMRDGIVEFLKNCVFNKTACAIHVMNVDFYNQENNIKELPILTTNLPALAVQVQKIMITGSTPMFETLDRAIRCKNSSRYIIFSDGEPNFGTEPALYEAAGNCKEAKTPIDTVYIGTDKTDNGAIVLKKIADLSGGFFLHYKPGESNFGAKLRQLAPVQRLSLTRGD